MEIIFRVLDISFPSFHRSFRSHDVKPIWSIFLLKLCFFWEFPPLFCYPNYEVSTGKIHDNPPTFPDTCSRTWGYCLPLCLIDRLAFFDREATSSASPVDAPSLGRSKLLLSYLSQQLKSLSSVKQCSGSPNSQPVVHEGWEDRSLDPFEEILTRNQIKRNELEMHSDSDSSSSTDKIEAQYSSYETNKNLLSSSTLKTSTFGNVNTLKISYSTSINS